MQQTNFWKTNLKVGRTSFGCIPIQHVRDKKEFFKMVVEN